MDSIIIEDKEFSLYLTSGQIADEVKRIAREMDNDLAGQEVVFLVVLNGAFMFAADLLRHIHFQGQVSFIRASSYMGMTTSGKVRTLLPPEEKLENKTVVIIEDILDTGLTLESIISGLGESGIKQCKIATLLYKPDASKAHIEPHYVGFRIPNRFVVGYGLDYNGFGRNRAELYMFQGD